MLAPVHPSHLLRQLGDPLEPHNGGLYIFEEPYAVAPVVIPPKAVSPKITDRRDVIEPSSEKEGLITYLRPFLV